MGRYRKKKRYFPPIPQKTVPQLQAGGGNKPRGLFSVKFYLKVVMWQIKDGFQVIALLNERL